jgi:ergothioneine biosynthesis protein EgtB
MQTVTPVPDAAPDAGALALRYLDVRGLTEELSAHLSPEDQTVQSMPDASPTKWHRAHTTWFFETFVLERADPDHAPFDPCFRMLFNSYYHAVGPRFERPMRGVISRPGASEVAAYRTAVDEQMLRVLHAGALEPDLVDLVVLGLHHEQQHQELLLMDIKHAFSLNPLAPIYRHDERPVSSAPVAPLQWVEIDAGLVEVGADTSMNSGFSFDSEGPRHRVFLESFQLASRLVTVAEWLEFIDDGGYRRPELWLSDGWYAVEQQGLTAPLYWHMTDGDGVVHTMGGTRGLDHAEPVCHVSFYEADAFARWSGARLPTEFEWECAARAAGGDGGLGEHVDVGLHPRAAGAGLTQLMGSCWQWTSSAYLPYPGFAPAGGAVGEYNGKFMSGQMVLRGSSALTSPGHSRLTYRNFFPPGARWPMTGVRLAMGGGPQ